MACGERASPLLSLLGVPDPVWASTWLHPLPAQQTDKELLEFGQDISDSDVASEEEEESEGEEEESAEDGEEGEGAEGAKQRLQRRKKAAAAAAAAAAEEEQGQAEAAQAAAAGGQAKAVTLTAVEGWCRTAQEKHSLGAMRSLMRVYRVACHYGDSEEQVRELAESWMAEAGVVG